MNYTCPVCPTISGNENLIAFLGSAAGISLLGIIGTFLTALSTSIYYCCRKISKVTYSKEKGLVVPDGGGSIGISVPSPDADTFDIKKK